MKTDVAEQSWVTFSVAGNLQLNDDYSLMAEVQMRSRLLELKVDLMIFMSLCIVQEESICFGVCVSWKWSLLSASRVLVQLTYNS